ncbi:hypothetical protein HNY73_018868 [Argiope bruennichi]|uniref:GAG-pre-integrase domain-containing protein n=1 Tax=Argiope bruennichi TaxID=94029 RepID=A0A8T0EHQ4_ARGBR|nr:hypothetical protein HNY73_018868 [Argiope bruennichi]
MLMKAFVKAYHRKWNNYMPPMFNNALARGLTKYITPKPKEINSASNVTCTIKSESLGIWHERFCRINNEYIVKSSRNNSVRGLPGLSDNTSHCEHALLNITRTT